MPSPPRDSTIMAAALSALPPASAARARWSTARFPTLVDVGILQGLVHALGLNALHLLSDESAPTALERSGGNWEHVMDELGARAGQSVPALAAAFESHVNPSAASVSTRGKDWAGWRAVLTWATARSALPAILPMSLLTMRALLWDLLATRCTAAMIKGVVDGIQARHRRFGLPSPLTGPRAYSRLIQSMSRFQGRQRQLKLPISRDWVVRMLSLRGLSPATERNCLAAVTATVNCLRPSEGANLQTCDVLFGFDARIHTAYADTAALNIKERKTDQSRKGHHPRMGRASRREWDIVLRLRAMISAAGATPGLGCTKAARPHARCPVCPPLFPLFAPDGAPRMAAPSASAFSDMILKGLAAAGADPRDYCGNSARRGGITTAVEAGVPEVVLWLQSGHAADRSARTNIHLGNPDLLFQTWAAFRL